MFLLSASLLVLGRAGADAVSCAPDGTVRVVVALRTPAGTTIAGIVAVVDYPERAVEIPGSGDSPEVKARVTGMPEGFIGTPNDRDDDLVVAIAGTSALPSGPIFTVEFDRCRGEPKPAAKEFRCTVTQASTDMGRLVDGTTCTATAAGGSPTNTKKTREGAV